MEHLTIETLARLVDETPTPEERAHLARCEECVRELDELREQTRALGALPDVRPPRGDWAVLEARLVSEGLVHGENSLRTRVARTPAWMKAAAAILLFLGGTGLGVAVGNGGLPGAAMSAGVGGGGPYTLASTEASSIEEAASELRLAERRYIDALVQLRQLQSEQEGGSSEISPEARLAALEYLVDASQAAVRQTPADPFMNGLLASLLAERQAARQETVRRASAANGWF